MSTVFKNIDSGSPVMLSIGTGDYADHTVTITGYRKYQLLIETSEGFRREDRYMTKVSDHHDIDSRYIDMHDLSAINDVTYVN